MKTSLPNTHVKKRLWTLIVGRLSVSLWLAGSGVLSIHADRATIDPTKTQIAMPLSTPPTIDGTIDTDEWNRAGGFANDFWRVGADPNLTDGVLGGVVSFGTAPADNDDLSFRIYVGYDSDNLYVAVRVRDSVLQEDSAAADSMNGNTWEDDSVEVFVDGDNSNATRWAAAQPGGQYVITVNNAYRENEAGNPGYATAAWFAKTSRTDNGYDAEFRISLATLGNPKPGDIIGFTVAVNDDDDGASNERQIAWVGAAHEPVTYGNLMLNGRSYTAPKTAAPVMDGTINASEYSGATEIKVDGFNGIYDITSGDNTWEVTDHAYSAWVVHDADAIYVAVNVTDNQVVTDTAAAGSEDGSTWEDDSVEIFFDPNNSKDSGRGAEQFEGQYVFTANGAWRDNEANNPTFGQTEHWFAATSKTATGYAIEFKVKKSAILNPADGTSIGFHIAINDDDGSLPAPKMQLGWSGFAHAEFTYGTLTLGGPSTPSTPASVIYRETFGIAPGATVDSFATVFDWQRFDNNGAEITTTGSASGVNFTVASRPTDVGNVNAGPNSDGTFGAYTNGILYLGATPSPSIALTTEYSFDPQDYVPGSIAFSWYEGNNTAPHTFRLLVRVGTQWYASTAIFTTPAIPLASFGAQAELKTLTYNPTPTNWQVVNFNGDFVVGATPGTGTTTPSTLGVLSLVGNPASDLTGRITGFGVYGEDGGSGTGNRRIDGFTIQAAASAVAARPKISTIRLSGGNVVLSGTSGTPNGTLSLLTSTNVALPLSSWTSIATGSFDGSGNFAITNAITPGLRQSFYILRSP